MNLIQAFAWNVGTFVPRGYKRDGGGPSEIGMQVHISNHLKLLWSKAMVVSVEEKAYGIRQVGIKKVSDERTNVSVENVLWLVSKLGSRFCSKISLGDTCLLPRWHPAYSWHELDSGSFVERGNPSCDVKRKPYKCSPRRGKVSRHMKGADHPVVVKKFL